MLTWCLETLAHYRSLQGEPRRRLASRIIRDNEPLLRTLGAQLCGRWRSEKTTFAARLGGTAGFSELSRDDVQQAGRIAMMKALDQYDAERGKHSYLVVYLASKFRHELQCLVAESRAIRTPWTRGQALPPREVDVVDEAKLDRLRGGEEDAHELPEGVTVEQLEHWILKGDWPE